MKGKQEMTTKELIRMTEELKERVEKLEVQSYQYDKPLYSVSEVADMFGVTKEAIYKRIKKGELPTIKLGTIKIRACDLREIMGSIA